MHRMSFTPLAEFFELNLTFHFALVFTCPIIDALAFGALQFD